jgi:membrane-bound metal-dependent hydrolase YbcI (DUF457 family)
MAIAPDFDFLPGILVGQPALYHQTITHSLSVAVVVSGALTLLYNRTQRTRMVDWGRFCSAYSSHLVIDLFGVDRRPPFGMPLLWPFSNQAFLAPWELFPGVRHAAHTATTTAEWLVNIFQPANLEAIGMEIFLLLPVVLLVRFARLYLVGRQRS